MTKCVYCKTQISESSVVDVCRRCGLGVWGEKMFNAIIQNMEGARESGDLYQGSVWETPSKPVCAPAPISAPVREVSVVKSSPFNSMVEEAKESERKFNENREK